MADKDKKKEERDLEALTQVAEGVGTGGVGGDERASMDVTGPQKGGPEGEDRADWDEPGVDTGGGLDPSSATPSGGNWGDTTGLSNNAAEGSDWVSGPGDGGIPRKRE
jgi:hypothetical protein